MTNANDRLKQIRKARGYKTATKAAQAFGWNVNTYRSHENGVRGVPADQAEKYATAYQVTLDWLLTGKNTPKTKGEHLQGSSGKVQIVQYRFAPLFSLDQVLSMASYSVQDVAKEHDEVVPITAAEDMGPNVFAIYVFDERMTSLSGGDSFQEGDVVYFDPDKRCKPGDYVLAITSPDGDAVFGIYQERLTSTGGKTVEIAPLNEHYASAPILERGKILGTLVYHGKKYPRN